MAHSRLFNKPLLFDAKRAHARGVVSYTKDGVAKITYKGLSAKVPKEHQYDLTQPTMFGLNERLTHAATSPKLSGGTTLRDLFNKEWERYSALVAGPDGRKPSLTHGYGVYAYYPRRNHLARFAPAFWHNAVAVASSAKLLADPSRKLTWRAIRDIFDRTVVAVAGGSVGSSIFHTVAMDMRPSTMKIADKSMYKMENINRVRLAYHDIVEPNSLRASPTESLLRNKAIVASDQLYSIDPFATVYVYAEGLSDESIPVFIRGNGTEPAADIIVEEIDEPRLKLKIREEARRARKPVIMMTDIGSAVQMDILRYDLNPKLPLSYGIADHKLWEATERVYDDPGNRAAFYAFVDALIGKHYRTDEIKEIIEGRFEIPTSTIIPQLGSTAAMAGALAAETIARMRLGEEYPSRAIINKRTLKVKSFT